MSNALVPLDQMQTMAAACAKSGLFGAKTPEQALTIMLLAQAEGRHPMSAAKDYDIINGKPAKKAEAMLRDFLATQGSVEWHTLDDTKADATFAHPQGGRVRIVWDMERVKKAEIKNEAMYKKFPRAMLRSRCVSEGVRTVCPGATSGLYEPGEVAGFTEKNMGPAPVIEPTTAEKIEAALKKHGVDKALVLAHAQAESLDEINDADLQPCIDWIAKRAKTPA